MYIDWYKFDFQCDGIRRYEGGMHEYAHGTKPPKKGTIYPQVGTQKYVVLCIIVL